MPSYVVNLQGGGQMTVNASSPAAAVTNVIAQGGTPASGTTVTNAPSSAAPSSVPSGASSAPAFNRDLTIAFVVLVLCGIAIAVSGWKAGARFVQVGLVVAIVVVIVRDEPQLTHFLSFLGSGGASG